MELDKSIQEKTEKFEKEKHMFLEQSKQLRVELEQVKGERDQLHGLQKDQESELTKLWQNTRSCCPSGRSRLLTSSSGSPKRRMQGGCGFS